MKGGEQAALVSICMSTRRVHSSWVSSHGCFFFSVFVKWLAFSQAQADPSLGRLKRFPGDHSTWSMWMRRGEEEEEVVPPCFPLYSLVGTGAVACWKEMVNFFFHSRKCPLFLFFPAPFMLAVAKYFNSFLLCHMLIDSSHCRYFHLPLPVWYRAAILPHKLHWFCPELPGRSGKCLKMASVSQPMTQQDRVATPYRFASPFSSASPTAGWSASVPPRTSFPLWDLPPSSCCLVSYFWWC